MTNENAGKVPAGTDPTIILAKALAEGKISLSDFTTAVAILKAETPIPSPSVPVAPKEPQSPSVAFLCSKAA